MFSKSRSIGMVSDKLEKGLRKDAKFTKIVIVATALHFFIVTKIFEIF